MKNIVFQSLLMVLVSLSSAFAANVQLQTDTFTLQFAADGKPSSLIVTDSGQQLLNQASPGDGFYITNSADARIRLTTLEHDDDTLIATSDNGTQQVVFSVIQQDQYLRFVIERLKGFPTNSGFVLAFNMNVGTDIKVFSTDYMTDEYNREDSVAVKWNYLWNRNAANPLGSFALYHADDDDTEDDILIKIWAREGLPHPRINGEWTYNKAKDWIATWQEMFADQSQFILEAESPEDLYDGVKYAEMLDAAQIYIFTNTWRGAFWPTTQSFCHLRPEVFPGGVQDLRAYSDHLLDKGIYLKFHFLSGSIGRSDPDYIARNPDRRLASWGGGTIAGPVGADDTTILFNPEPSVELPSKLGRGGGNFTLTPPLLNSVNGFNNIRIENEIILVGNFEETDTGVWKFTDCRRGMYTTEAAAHAAGADVAGLIDTYGQNFIPDNDSTMLEELGKSYADLCNDGGVYNVEFDGFENNAYNGRWGSEKFAAMVYKHLDHPCTSGGSAGRPPDCWIEYKLNSTKRLMDGFRFNVHSSYRAPLFIDSPAREATNLLECHYELSQGAAAGAPGLGLSKPQPMFGLTIDELTTHGLSDKIAETVKNWKNAAQYMTPEQCKTIRNSLNRLKKRLPDASNDPQSALVHWLDKVNDTTYTIKPLKVLTRRQGDIQWHSWQEHGPIQPKQFIKPGDELELENPYAPQELQFVIRVLAAAEYGSANNYSLQPDADILTNRRDTEITQIGTGLSLSQDNRGNDDLRNPGNLPQWSRASIDMTHHRSIGMYVTGDNSNAVLVFQIPRGDYVVPINFTGRKYIEIPHGQAAWANGFWGWRIGTHHGNYENVGRFNVGLGLVPATTTVSVTVEGIKALEEIPTMLVNPVITTATGSLTIHGEIETSWYLEYRGGDTATVYDKNWTEIKQLKVTATNYIMPQGYSTITVTSDAGEPVPWLATQFITEGAPMIVTQND
jgi:hypothetical protein